MEDLRIHAHHQGHGRILTGDMFGGIAQRGGPAKLLEADQMRVAFMQIKEQVGACFKAVIGAVIDDGRQINGGFQHGFEMRALGCNRGTTRQNTRNDHQAAGSDFFGMGGQGAGPLRVLGACTDNHRHTGFQQSLDALHALLVGQ